MTYVNSHVTNTGLSTSSKLQKNGVAGVEVDETTGTPKVGMFGATPVAQAAITALTDNSGGTAADTIAAAGAVYDQAVENAFRASVSDKINELITLLKNLGPAS